MDEEGRLKEQTVGFKLHEMPGIAGNALVVCHDEDGNFTDVHRHKEPFLGFKCNFKVQILHFENKKQNSSPRKTEG